LITIKRRQRRWISVDSATNTVSCSEHHTRCSVIGPIGIVHIWPSPKFRKGKYGYFCRSFRRELGKEGLKRSIKVTQQFGMGGGLIGVRIKPTKAGRKNPHTKVGIDEIRRHQQLPLQSGNAIGKARPRRSGHRGSLNCSHVHTRQSITEPTERRRGSSSRLHGPNGLSQTNLVGIIGEGTQCTLTVKRKV
jgi:hypothetical protein